MPVALGPRAEFIENNLGLVHACAGRFKGRGIEYDDLYAAGCMGLVKAYDGFDESRGLDVYKRQLQGRAAGVQKTV